MPDPKTIERLRGLILSAKDLRELTDWPAALVEDYLNLLDNFIVFANLVDGLIDKKIEEIPTDFTDGSVPYADDGFLVEDNTNFFWDITNELLKLKALILNDATASRLLSTDADKEVVSVADLTSWIAGTADQIAVTDNGDGTVTISIPGALDMLNFNINNLANAIDIHDAATLEDVLNSANIILNYWIQATSTLGFVFSNTPGSGTELVTTGETELTNADTFFKSSVADTPTPIEIMGDAIILVHIQAEVDATLGRKDVALHAELYYVDADGTTSPVKIGEDSTSTGTLTADKAAYELHLHVPSEITVPTGKRFWLRIFATASGSGGDATVEIYNGDSPDHISIPVAGSILGNFLQLSGGTMSGDIDMDGNNLANVETIDLTGGQIAFPSTAVPSADPNTLDDYEEYTAADTPCTGALTVSVVYRVLKIGNLVTLLLPTTFGAGVAETNFNYGVQLPSKYRPIANTSFVIARIKDDNSYVATPGLIHVNTAGTIAVYKDGTGSTNFTVTAEAGIDPVAVSWIIY